MSSEEKNCRVNHPLLSSLLPPPGCAPDEVIPLSDPILRVLQKNRARSRNCCDGRDENHGDDARRVDGRDETHGDDARRVDGRDETHGTQCGAASPLQSNEGGVIGQRKAKSVPLKATSKRIPSIAAPTSIQMKAASKIITPMNNSSRTVAMSIKAMLKTIPPRAVSLPSTLPKSSESVRELVKTAISEQRLPRNTQAKASPSLPVQLESLGSNKKSMKELLEEASKVMKEVARRREIEKMRAAARLEVEQMVRTVEFNHPYIDPQDVFK